jgi:DNA polymerase V
MTQFYRTLGFDQINSQQITILAPELSSSDLGSTYQLPIFLTPVQAGFPSPATDYQEAKFDLNTHLIANPNATFFVRVDGDSMVGANVQSGDIAIVDRSLEARNGDVILAVIDGDFTIKRLEITDKKAKTHNAVTNFEPIKEIKVNTKTVTLEVKYGYEAKSKTPHKLKKITLSSNTHNFKRIRLLPENSAFAPIEITGNMTFVVWGVVTSVIHRLR